MLFQKHPIEDYDHFAQVVGPRLCKYLQDEDPPLIGRQYMDSALRYVVELLKAPSSKGALYALHVLVLMCIILMHDTNEMAVDYRSIKPQNDRVEGFITDLLQRRPLQDPEVAQAVVPFPDEYGALPLAQRMRKAWYRYRDDQDRPSMTFGDQFAPCNHERNATALALLHSCSEKRSERLSRNSILR